VFPDASCNFGWRRRAVLLNRLGRRSGNCPGSPGKAGHVSPFVPVSVVLLSDPVLKGVFIAFAAFAVYALSDANIKFLDGQLPAYEVGFFGAVFGLAAIPFLKRRDDRWGDVVRTTNRPLWLTRFAANGFAGIGAVVAFTHLPMSEAFALIFLLPAFVTIMSVLFLKEKVAARRWVSVVIGFIGVLIVLRPGFRELSIGHLGALMVALGGAISIVVYRAAGPSEKNISLYGAGVLGTFTICGIAMIPFFEWPSLTQVGFLAGYGIFAALGAIFLMLAAQRAPAALVGPTQYSQILWALLLDRFVFGIELEMAMIGGIVLIVGSGLMTLWRDKPRGTQKAVRAG
jgi:drug/metabolite transporter (DMT)-like permease